jgi:hypothetical protein
VGLSEFHDSLDDIIHFSGDISDGHHRGEIFLIRRCPFSYFTF